MFFISYFGLLMCTKIFVVIRMRKVTEYSAKTGLGKRLTY